MRFVSYSKRTLRIRGARSPASAYARAFSTDREFDKKRLTGRRQSPLAYALVLFAFLAFSGSCPRPGLAQQGEDLIGLKIGRFKIDAVLVLKQGPDYWLPVKETSKLLAIEIKKAEPGGSQTLKTPLGELAAPDGALRQHQGQLYLSTRYLKSRLNAQVSFDESDGVLAIRLPWRAGTQPLSTTATGPGNAGANQRQKVDAEPPAAAVSTIHGEAAFARSARAGSTFSGNFRITGHAHGGVWQVNYHEDLDNRRAIRDAIWTKMLTPRHWLQVGHQSAIVHPLLQATEFSGAQIAWTNMPERVRRSGLHPGLMIGRWTQTNRTFSGTGPVGGYAELWVDGRNVSQTPIALDRAYRF